MYSQHSQRPVQAFVTVTCWLLHVTASAAPNRPLDPIAAQLEPTRTVTYKQVDARQLKLHVFEPDGHKASDRRSAFVIFHGGGWTGGSPRRVYPFADYFRSLGVVAISVEYRLLRKDSGVTVFDCVKDGRSAIRYLRQHAEEFGVDPQKIVVAGCSAGGHVAAGTALFDGVDESSDEAVVSSVPNALILYYPVIDTSPAGYGQKKIGEYWQQLSPVHHVRENLPPTIVFHGTADTVTPYAGARAFDEKMRKAGNDCELVSHKDGIHGHLIFDLQLFESAMERTRTFLQAKSFLKSARSTGAVGDLPVEDSSAERHERVAGRRDGIPKKVSHALKDLPARKVSIAIIGDSTAASYPKPPADRPDLTGWGQVLGEFFTDQVEVINHARSGRSAKSFLREGHWKKTLALKPDYVFIQFGHNDQPGKGDRTTDPEGDYRDYLGQYIREARDTGIRPILVTPMTRRRFENGKVRTTLGPWAAATRAVGQEQQIPVIDLHTASVNFLNKLGDEGSADLSPSVSDRTHFSRKGALAMARLIVLAIPDAEPRLKCLLRE